MAPTRTSRHQHKLGDRNASSVKWMRRNAVRNKKRRNDEQSSEEPKDDSHLKPIELPYRAHDGFPVSLKEPDVKLLANPFSVRDSYVLFASLLYSRQVWTSGKMFQKFWTRPVRGKKLAEGEFNARERMNKLCECKMTIGPHTFDVRLFAIRDDDPRRVTIYKLKTLRNKRRAIVDSQGNVIREIISDDVKKEIEAGKLKPLADLQPFQPGSSSSGVSNTTSSQPLQKISSLNQGSSPHLQPSSQLHPHSNQSINPQATLNPVSTQNVPPSTTTNVPSSTTTNVPPSTTTNVSPSTNTPVIPKENSTAVQQPVGIKEEQPSGGIEEKSAGNAVPTVNLNDSRTNNHITSSTALKSPEKSTEVSSIQGKNDSSPSDVKMLEDKLVTTGNTEDKPQQSNTTPTTQNIPSAGNSDHKAEPAKDKSIPGNITEPKDPVMSSTADNIPVSTEKRTDNQEDRNNVTTNQPHATTSVSTPRESSQPSVPPGTNSAPKPAIVTSNVQPATQSSVDNQKSPATAVAQENTVKTSSGNPSTPASSNSTPQPNIRPGIPAGAKQATQERRTQKAPASSANITSKQSGPAKKAADDSMKSPENHMMIANLNAIARVDPSLNTLMKIVASGKATQEQIVRFQGYISKAKAMGYQGYRGNGTLPPNASSTQSRNNTSASSPSGPNAARLPGWKEHANVPSGNSQYRGDSRTTFNNYVTNHNRPNEFNAGSMTAMRSGRPTGTLYVNKTPVLGQENLEPRRKIPRIEKKPRKSLASKDSGLQSQHTERIIGGSTIVFEFTENPTSRFILPKDAIAELLSNQEILVSFFLMHEFEDPEILELIRSLKYDFKPKEKRQKKSKNAKKSAQNTSNNAPVVPAETENTNTPVGSQTNNTVTPEQKDSTENPANPPLHTDVSSLKETQDGTSTESKDNRVVQNAKSPAPVPSSTDNSSSISKTTLPDATKEDITKTAEIPTTDISKPADTQSLDGTDKTPKESESANSDSSDQQKEHDPDAPKVGEPEKQESTSGTVDNSVIVVKSEKNDESTTSMDHMKDSSITTATLKHNPESAEVKTQTTETPQNSQLKTSAPLKGSEPLKPFPGKIPEDFGEKLKGVKFTPLSVTFSEVPERILPVIEYSFWNVDRVREKMQLVLKNGVRSKKYHVWYQLPNDPNEKQRYEEQGPSIGRDSSEMVEDRHYQEEDDEKNQSSDEEEDLDEVNDPNNLSGSFGVEVVEVMKETVLKYAPIPVEKKRTYKRRAKATDAKEESDEDSEDY